MDYDERMGMLDKHYFSYLRTGKESPPKWPTAIAPCSPQIKNYPYLCPDNGVEAPYMKAVIYTT